MTAQRHDGPRRPLASKRRSLPPARDGVADIYTRSLVPVPNDIADIIPIRRGPKTDHPHPLKGARDAADLKRYQQENIARKLDERKSRYHREALKRSLAMLPADLRRSEDEIYDDYISDAPPDLAELGTAAVREWAAQRAHEDMAAAILSVGGSQYEAALHAGVAPSTVGRMLKQPEFVARVNQEKRRLLGRVQGGALAELERRIFSGESLMMDTKDLLSVIQRTGDLGGDQVVAPAPRPQASGGGGHNGGDGQVTIYSQLTAIASGGNSGSAQHTADDPQLQLAESGVVVRNVTPAPSVPGGNAVGAGGARDGGAQGADFPVIGLVGDTVAEDVPPV